MTKEFNGFLKQANMIERKTIRRIFQTYCDLKHDMQNITQVIIFFKTCLLIIHLALALYETRTIFRQFSDDELIMNSFVTLLLVYWILEFVLEICFFLCPFIIYYRETSMTIFLYDDILDGSRSVNYKEEIFYLQSQSKRLKFTAHGLFELDWPLLYTIAALVSTYLIYLVQFQQLIRA
ncbi:hypothetical protein Zmor_006362 [Zophobas morio]|uniref:Gustatory receptor n=1 Tax=Zophobas morio TaxID=2755281 RepID=A0AA38IPV6_9CUCU|nr:hypothetical protein Zmor_006362 [Zophobas morio]